LKERLFWILLVAFLATSSYLGFCYLGEHKIQMKIVPDNINTKSKSYQIINYQFVEGETRLTFNRDITQMDIVPFSNYQLNEIRRLTRNCFLVLSDKECLVKSIHIFVNNSQEGSSYELIVSAKSRPRFRWSLFLPQFIFLFFLAGAFSTAVIFVWRLLFALNPVEPWLTIIVWFLTAILLTCFIYFLCMTPFQFLSGFGLSWLRLIIVNLVIAIVLLTAFFIFQGKRFSRVLWFVTVLVFFFLLFNPTFNPKKIGDANCLTFNLRQMHLCSVPLSEMLSLIWLKGIQVFFRNLGIIKDTAAVFTIGAKVLGILYIFALYFLTKTFSIFSGRGRVMFFLGALALPLSLMFTGIPEISFYSSPFLIFGIAFAIRYLQKPSDWSQYILAIVFFLVAGFFHGSSFLSFPVLLLLPFLPEMKTGYDSQRKWIRYITAALIVVFTIAVIVIASIGLTKLAGFQIEPGSAGGGSDGRLLVFFSPQFCFFESIPFLSNRYFWLHGWIVTVAFPLVFFLLPFLLRRIMLEGEELLLLLVALSQIVIFLFFGFDLGVRDFDLFITLFSWINLFFLLVFSRIAERMKQYWGFVFFLLLGLLHPSYLIFKFASM